MNDMFPYKTLNLEKIKDAISTLSDEEYEELEVWMASQDDEDEDEDEDDVDEEEGDFDYEDTPPTRASLTRTIKTDGKGWY
jgi:hypothetical protein